MQLPSLEVQKLLAVISESIYLLLLLFVFYELKQELKSSKSKKLPVLPFKFVIKLFIVGITYLLTMLLSNIFKVPRPFQKENLNILFHSRSYSFPSSHASTSSTAAYLSKNKYFYLWSIAISISRVLLGQHTYLDIIAGLLFGQIIGLSLEKLAKLTKLL